MMNLPAVSFVLVFVLAVTTQGCRDTMPTPLCRRDRFFCSIDPHFIASCCETCRGYVDSSMKTTNLKGAVPSAKVEGVENVGCRDAMPGPICQQHRPECFRDAHITNNCCATCHSGYGVDSSMKTSNLKGAVQSAKIEGVENVGCRDELPFCSQDRHRCFADRYFTESCKMTCGICHRVSPMKTYQKDAVQSAKVEGVENVGCRDELPFCPHERHNCFRDPYITQHCKMTCGTCYRASSMKTYQKMTLGLGLVLFGIGGGAYWILTKKDHEEEEGNSEYDTLLLETQA